MIKTQSHHKIRMRNIIILRNVQCIIKQNTNKSNIFTPSYPCIYTVLSVYLHRPIHVFTPSYPCIYNVLSMYLQRPIHVFTTSYPCIYNVRSMYLHRPIHVFTLSYPCMYTVLSVYLPVHQSSSPDKSWLTIYSSSSSSPSPAMAVKY